MKNGLLLLVSRVSRVSRVSSVSGLALLLALSGCSEPSSALACDSAKATNLVKDAINTALLEQSGADDSVKFSYVLDAIETLETDADTGSLVCSADLAVNLKNDYMDETLNRNINYSVELGDEDQPLLVKVFERE